jgi:hypothetical protein
MTKVKVICKISHGSGSKSLKARDGTRVLQMANQSPIGRKVPQLFPIISSAHVEEDILTIPLRRDVDDPYLACSIDG